MQAIPSAVDPSERLQTLKAGLEGLVSSELGVQVSIKHALFDATGHGGCYSAPVLQVGTVVSGRMRTLWQRAQVAFELSPGYLSGEETGQLEIAGQPAAGATVLTIQDIVSAAVRAGYDIITRQGEIVYPQAPTPQP